MAKNQVRRLQQKQRAANIYAIEGLDNIKNYAPNNKDFTSVIAHGKFTDMQKLQALHTQAEGNLKAARDALVAGEWEFHNIMLGVKKQVISQFGDNSNEIQGMGLKKKVEYKSRKSKKAIPAETKKEK